MKVNPVMFGVLFTLQAFLIVVAIVSYYDDTISPVYCWLSVVVVSVLQFVFLHKKDLLSIAKSIVVGACVGMDICIFLLMLNYYTASCNDSPEIYKCKIDHFRSVYHPGTTYRRHAHGPYTSFYYTIHLPQGEKEISVYNREKWQKLKRKGTITVEMKKGILGFPVIKAKY